MAQPAFVTKRLTVLFLAAASVGFLAACAAILGDFTVEAGEGQDGAPSNDVVAVPPTDAPHDTSAPGDAGVDTGPEPVTCAQTADDASAPILIASGQANPAGIAVTATDIYWGNEGSGTVVKCPLSGCAGGTTPVFSGGAPFFVRVDATNVYWNNGFSTLQSCPLAGCPAGGPTLYGGAATKVGGFTIDANFIYWTQTQTGDVYKCPLAGCTTPTLLWEGHTFGPSYGIGVTATDVYWVDEGLGQVLRAPLTGVPVGGTPQLVATGLGNETYATLSKGKIFWTESGSPGNVLSAPLDGDGGAGRVLQGNLAHPRDIIVDEVCSTVYWATAGEGVMDGGNPGAAINRCPVLGCNQNQPLGIFAGNQGGPFNLTQDATYIYWTNYNGGTVWKRHK
jgi:hypothetical protein